LLALINRLTCLFPSAFVVTQARLQLDDERTELDRELNEMQNQLEDDIDTEIENMKRVNEDKLAVSRETTLKYKGENGIMKKKSVLMHRDIEDQKEEMKHLLLKEKELHDQIKLLEKEVSAHKKEIKTRDVSIGEKEKRIYELKKKNQELDKFKFVLDFKIRELKQQIEPRQQEIMAMREKIKDMDNELERYHKSNAALDALIGDLRSKIDVLQTQVRTKRMTAKTMENSIETCRSDVQAAIVHIQTHPLLLAKVKSIVEVYGSMENVRPRIDPEVEEEYARHKEYLQRTIQELKQALEEGSVHHMTTNNAIRNSNMSLINEINAQRESNRQLKNHVQAEIGRIRHFAQAMNMKKQKNSKLQGSVKTEPAPKLAAALFAADSVGGGGDSMEPGDLLEKNRRRIAALRAALAELDARSRGMMAKAVSREVLPPMDGVSGANGGYNQPVSFPQIAGAQGSGKSGIAINSDSLAPSPMPDSKRKKSMERIELPPVTKPTKQSSSPLDMGDSMFSPGDMQIYSPGSHPGDTYTTQYVEPDEDRLEENTLEEHQFGQNEADQAFHENFEGLNMESAVDMGSTV